MKYFLLFTLIFINCSLFWNQTTVIGEVTDTGKIMNWVRSPETDGNGFDYRVCNIKYTFNNKECVYISDNYFDYDINIPSTCKVIIKYNPTDTNDFFVFYIEKR